MSSLKNSQGFSTRAIHAGQRSDPTTGAVMTPIYATSTYAQESPGVNKGYEYARGKNPTREAFEACLADLEGGTHGFGFASGMAATSTALLALLESGDEVVCSAAIYGGTLHLLADLFPRWGISARFVSLDEMAQPAKMIGDRTKLVWFESPINPTLRCVDIAAIASACRARGVTSVIDNTFASPLNQRPIAAGVDVVMHSVTKYLNGHSDITAGAIAGPTAILERIDKTRRLLGGVIDPHAAYAIGRGLKTLTVRMERHNANALAIAQWLEQDPRVEQVLYPGLPSHPDHELAARQMRGFGGMVCVDVGGGQAGAERFFDRLKVIKRAASLGGVESLCSIPVLTSQWGHTDAQLAEAGITRSMVRLSIGLEDPQDLIDDIDQALGR
jgi:cystathionine beta-lyase/cystathionine gamma-synthase